MQARETLVLGLLVVLGLTVSSGALAQTSAVHFQIGFTLGVDCDQPFQVRNVSVIGDGSGVLNADKSASADLTIRAFVLSTRIHFEGRLGAPPQSGPGGATQVRVAGPHQLRLIWYLPNNQLITNISVSGRSCAVNLDAKLKPGAGQYTLFDGQVYHYCGRPRVLGTSCRVY
jgi:hypothetical protein